MKPEFAGKPDEDVETHLLRMNDWMDTHQFQEGVKVQHFLSNISRGNTIMVQIITTYKCRLDHVTKSIQPTIFKDGNTREQLFHAWGSFHFNANTETLDSHVTYILRIHFQQDYIGYFSL